MELLDRIPLSFRELDQIIENETDDNESKRIVLSDCDDELKIMELETGPKKSVLELQEPINVIA